VSVYRNRSYSTLITGVAILFALGSIVAAVARDGDPSLTQRAIPVLPVLALSAFCLARLARAGVYADDEGIRILNPLRSVRVPWDHILRFTVRASKGFPAVGFAELVDGREIMIWGIQSRSGTAVAKRIPAEVVEELNERLRVEREAAESAAHS